MATALALCAAVIGRFWKRPALTHSLWLLVLLKLVTPPLVPVSVLPSSWSQERAEAAPAVRPTPPAPEPPVVVVQAPLPPTVTEPAPAVRRSNVKEVGDPKAIARRFNESAKEAAAMTAPAIVDAAPPQAPVTPAPVEVVAPPPAPEPAPALPAPPEPQPVLFQDLAPLIGLFWLLGSLGWFGLAARRILAFRRLLRFARPAPEGVQRLARDLASRIGLRHCPGVWLVPGPLAPMVWAAGGPARVLFPADLLDRLDEDGVATLLAQDRKSVG